MIKHQKSIGKNQRCQYVPCIIGSSGRQSPVVIMKNQLKTRKGSKMRYTFFLTSTYHVLYLPNERRYENRNPDTKTNIGMAIHISTD